MLPTLISAISELFIFLHNSAKFARFSSKKLDLRLSSRIHSHMLPFLFTDGEKPISIHRELQYLSLDDALKDTSADDQKPSTQPSVAYSGEKDGAGLPHGYGSCEYFDSGIKYQGEFVNGQPHGKTLLVDQTRMKELE